MFQQVEIIGHLVKSVCLDGIQQVVPDHIARFEISSIPDTSSTLSVTVHNSVRLGLQDDMQSPNV